MFQIDDTASAVVGRCFSPFELLEEETVIGFMADITPGVLTKDLENIGDSKELKHLALLCSKHVQPSYKSFSQ